jgi:tetratricopeptide (TPR) repeat protein
VSEDSWEDALKQYRRAIEVSEGHQQHIRLDSLRQALQIEIQINQPFSAKEGDSLVALAQGIQEMRVTIDGMKMRQGFPESDRFIDLQETIRKRIQSIVARLRERGQTLLDQAGCTWIINEKLPLLDKAVTSLDQAHRLLPEDTVTDHLLWQAKVETGGAKDAYASLREAERHMATGDEGSLDLARRALEKMCRFIHDPVCQILVSDCLDEFLFRSNSAQEQAQWNVADDWLRKAESLHNSVFLSVDATNQTSDKVNRLKEHYDSRLTKSRARLCFDHAQALTRDRQYEQAVELYEEILHIAPNSPYLRFQSQVLDKYKEQRDLRKHLIRGMACLRAEDGVGAVEAFSEVLEIDPDDPKLEEADPDIQELFHKAVLLKRRQEGWSSLSCSEQAQLVLAGILLLSLIYLLARLV